MSCPDSIKEITHMINQCKGLVGIGVFLSCFVSAFAQQLVESPLMYNPVLQELAQERDQKWSFHNYEKNQEDDCPQLDAVTYLLSGESETIEVDTTGLNGKDGNLMCLNCDELVALNVRLDSTMLNVEATMLDGALQESILIRFCNRDTCYNLPPYDYVVRRPNRNIEQPLRFFGAEQDTAFCLPIDSLPGAFQCAQFVDCMDDYEGLSVVDLDRNCFYYRASRYAGLDSVCVVLCDEFTVCDTVRLAFEVRQDTIGLPFMDDFSYDLSNPIGKKWLERDPFVNRTLAIDPPSIGVATFDGIDGDGTPYKADRGQGDQLTTMYLDLTNAASPAVSFWVQRQGLGDRPEELDTFVVEFRNALGGWDEQATFFGVSDEQVSAGVLPFEFSYLPISTSYYHDAFQVRFRSSSPARGASDLWHLDYVRISENMRPDGLFNDVALTRSPSSMLAPYTSMPWNHFEDEERNELATDFEVGLYNHSLDEVASIPLSEFKIVDKASDETLISRNLLEGIDANTPQGMPVKRDLFLDLDAAAAAISNVTPSDSLVFLETVYRVEPSSQVTDQGFEPVKANDEVRRTTVFDNYFAYDDGTAESNIQLERFNNVAVELAVEFHTNVDDELRGVRLNLPHVTRDVGNQNFHLKVWVGELEGDPDYRMDFVDPIYADNFVDTLHGFTTYPLRDAFTDEETPVFIPAGKFYVGIEQASNCEVPNCIPLGYDRNSPDAKAFTFVKTGQTWEPLPVNATAGAVMIRPVVGKVTPIPTNVTTLQVIEQFQLSPNPSTGKVELAITEASTDDFELQCYNQIGQLVYNGAFRSTLDLSHLSDGIYIIKAVNAEQNIVLHQKLVLAR